ncbi:MAG: hypothetical protein LBV80_08785 [Deltaproteobacteria bacterium]|jgi:hypothetical protein|nr:hypothetical protein [Deltaproteobacteria bacterium]
MDIELTPKLLPGRLVNVTDISAIIELKGRMGMITLPLRSLIADKKLEVGDEVEVYLSYARVTKPTIKDNKDN